MADYLPPLNALRAFEAAARLQSFKNAASELNVTPAAVSQQIRQLEEHIGAKLFVRTTRSLTLTDKGRRTAPLLRQAFDLLHGAARELRDAPDAQTLMVSVNPSFGSLWLLPRLERFAAAHPEIRVGVESTAVLADFQRGNVDIAIRQGRGNYAGLACDLLLSDFALVVCSPRYLDQGKPLSEAADLKGQPLLHVDWPMETAAAPSWQRWQRHHGLEALDISGGMRFSTEDLAVRAALAGMGFVLATYAYVSDDLKAGRLVRALPEKYDMPTVFHHYLVYPPLVQGRPKKVAIFRDWLLSEVASRKKHMTSV
ncbi:MAG: transcriptional regulator GcvA [Pseudomonadota bacterium]